MKKVLCFVAVLALLLGMAACGSSEESAPDDEAAVGAIFVHAGQELPENTKVYADFDDNSYTFDLDAACVYYFSSREEADVAYAGDQNFTSMTFAANLDRDTVGAEGTVAYMPEEGAENAVAGVGKKSLVQKRKD